MSTDMSQIKHNSKSWIQTGLLNSQRIIDVSALYEKQDQLFYQSLAEFHAMTGCNFNSAFFRKAKQRPSKLLQNCEQLPRAFNKLGFKNCDLSNDSKVFRAIKKFVSTYAR